MEITAIMHREPGMKHKGYEDDTKNIWTVSSSSDYNSCSNKVLGKRKEVTVWSGSLRRKGVKSRTLSKTFWVYHGHWHVDCCMV